MVKLPIGLLPGEKVIDSWVLSYRPPGGEKGQGLCTVTNLRIFCDTKSWPDTESEGCLVIPKSSISKIDVVRTQLEKRVILTLENGQQHEFNYGTLNIDRIVEAMSAL